VALGWREYQTISPPLIYLTSLLPRALTQCLFFGLLGRVVAGTDGEAYAFLGSLVMVIMNSTIMGVTHLTSFDFAVGVFWRIDRARMPTNLGYALRATPWLGEAIINTCACTLLIPLLLGSPELSLAAWRAAPVYLAIVVSTFALGVPVAIISAAYRADVLVANTLSYTLTVLVGLLTPIAALPRGGVLSVLLPAQSGISTVQPGPPHWSAATAVGLEHCRRPFGLRALA